MTLKAALPPITSPLEKRLALEYGAIFVTKAVPPSKIIYGNEEEVSAFQNSVQTSRQPIGDFEIELQSRAMSALTAAVRDAASKSLSITPRAADSGRRSFNDTVELWNRNVNWGLEHWLEAKKLSQDEADKIRTLGADAQVEAVLALEDTRQLYFGTFFDRSILYSVAAPGASQHLSMLAFDVTEYQSEAVESILAAHGWYRTVVGDLPHFTYLGLDEGTLEKSGLVLSVRKYNNSAYRFWLPDERILDGDA